MPACIAHEPFPNPACVFCTTPPPSFAPVPRAPGPPVVFAHDLVRDREVNPSFIEQLEDTWAAIERVAKPKPLPSCKQHRDHSGHCRACRFMLELHRLPAGPQRPYPSFADEATLIGQLLGTSFAGGTPDRAIPKNVLRFWSGGPMSAGTFVIVKNDCVRALSQGWKTYLFHSGTFEAWMAKSLGADKMTVLADQRKALSDVGCRIADIEGVCEGPEREYITLIAKAAAMEICSPGNRQGWAAIKYFSDFARLVYLRELGGIHMDTDMRLGAIDLARTYYLTDMKGLVPFMGALARERDETPVCLAYDILKNGMNDGIRDVVYRFCVGAVVDEARTASMMLNGLIAAPRRNPHVAAAAAVYMSKNKTGPGMAMGLNKILICGPEKMGAAPNIFDLCKFAVPPYVIRLETITDESAVGASSESSGVFGAAR